MFKTALDAETYGEGAYTLTFRKAANSGGNPQDYVFYFNVSTSASAPSVEKIVTGGMDGVRVKIPRVRKDGRPDTVTATFLFNRTGEVGGTFDISSRRGGALATTVQPQRGLAPLK